MVPRPLAPNTFDEAIEKSLGGESETGNIGGGRVGDFPPAFELPGASVGGTTLGTGVFASF